MLGATAKRGTDGLRKRCAVGKQRRKFREPNGNQGGEDKPRRLAWRKVGLRWVCGYCVRDGRVDPSAVDVD